MDSIREYMVQHPALMNTLYISVVCSVMKDVMYHLLRRREFEGTGGFWVLVGSLSDLLPSVGWTAIFFQLLGMSVLNALAVSTGLVAFNALYYQIMFLVPFEWLRAVLGSGVAIIAELAWVRYLRISWLESIPQLPMLIALAVCTFLVLNIGLSIVLLVWKRRIEISDEMAKIQEIMHLSLFQRLLIAWPVGWVKVREFVYVALTEQYWLAPGFVLEGIVMKVLYVLGWPFRAVNSWFWRLTFGR